MPSVTRGAGEDNRQPSHERDWLGGARELAQLLLDEVDLHQAMGVVSMRLAEISGAEVASVGLLDQGDPRVLVCEAVGGIDLGRWVGVRVPLRGLMAAAVEGRRPIVVQNLADDERYDPPTEWRQALTAVGRSVLIPLIAVDEAVGVLVAGWRRGSVEERLAAGEMDNVQMFANNAALVLRRVAAQEQRVRRDLWLQAIAQVAQLLLGDVDRDQAMRLVEQRLRQVSGADYVGLLIVDSTDASRVSALVFEGLERPVPPDLLVPRQGLVAAVLATGEPIVSEDYTRQKGYDPPSQWAAELGAVGLGMLMPIVVDSEVLGVLFVGWRRGSAHAQAALGEVEQVRTFADLAGLALQRIRSQDTHDQLLLLEQRNRIATHLGDIVLQRLFAACLELTTAHNLTNDPRVKQRLVNTVKLLDQTNAQVRKYIFRVPAGEPGGGVTQE